MAPSNQEVASSILAGRRDFLCLFWTGFGSYFCSVMFLACFWSEFDFFCRRFRQVLLVKCFCFGGAMPFLHFPVVHRNCTAQLRIGDSLRAVPMEL